MSAELSLWALLFILFIGVVWITILRRLQHIEKLLGYGFRPTNEKNSSPSDADQNQNPSDRDV